MQEREIKLAEYNPYRIPGLVREGFQIDATSLTSRHASMICCHS